MTKRTKSLPQATLPARPASWKRKLFRGLVIGAAVLGLGGVATLLPNTTPQTIVVPANKGLYITATESARAAYIQALMADGYEFMPTITLNDA